MCLRVGRWNPYKNLIFSLHLCSLWKRRSNSLIGKRSTHAVENVKDSPWDVLNLSVCVSGGLARDADGIAPPMG